MGKIIRVWRKNENSIPECEKFFKIRKAGEEFKTIEQYIQNHSASVFDELNGCEIIYRDKQITYKQYAEEFKRECNQMESLDVSIPFSVWNESFEITRYFINKIVECLCIARMFTMKSHQIMELDSSTPWKQGYYPQFFFRCVYFGTSTTWYSNAFDHILQTVYWGLNLYYYATDRDGKGYTDSWNMKKKLSCCTYDNVLSALNAIQRNDVRKVITTCEGTIETVKNWANHIKHRGGLDYQHLYPESELKVYYTEMDEEPVHENEDMFSLPSDAINLEYKSPVSIDIDEEFDELVKAHCAIRYCAEIINDLIF